MVDRTTSAGIAAASAALARKVNLRDPMQLPKEPRELTTIALDSTRSIAERLAAIDALIAQAPEAAKLVTLSLAEKTGEPREILEAARNCPSQDRTQRSESQRV